MSLRNMRNTKKKGETMENDRIRSRKRSLSDKEALERTQA